MSQTMELLRVLASMQGAFVAGVVLVILYYYLRRMTRFGIKELHILFVSASYLCLVAATIVTIYRMPYQLTDVWFWIIGVGYMLGDVSLIMLFRHAVIQNRHEKNP